MTIFQLYSKHCITQSFENNSVLFNKWLFRHIIFGSAKIGACIGIEKFNRNFSRGVLNNFPKIMLFLGKLFEFCRNIGFKFSRWHVGNFFQVLIFFNSDASLIHNNHSLNSFPAGRKIGEFCFMLNIITGICG